MRIMGSYHELEIETSANGKASFTHSLQHHAWIVRGLKLNVFVIEDPNAYAVEPVAANIALNPLMI